MRFPVFSSLLLDPSRCFYLLFLAVLPGAQGCRRPALTIQAPRPSTVPVAGSLSGHLPSHRGLGSSPVRPCIFRARMRWAPEGEVGGGFANAGAWPSPAPPQGHVHPTCFLPVLHATRPRPRASPVAKPGRDGMPGRILDAQGNLNFSSFGSISQAIFGTYLYF